jgi:hypothetical protein
MTPGSHETRTRRLYGRGRMSRHDDWKLKTAVVLKKQMPDGTFRYRISPRELRFEGDIPQGGFLSNLCKTEERAWHAAECCRWNKIYSSDFGEGY